jgi:hypothetical protein
VEKGIEKELKELDCCDKKGKRTEWYRSKLINVYRKLCDFFNEPVGGDSFIKDIATSLDHLEFLRSKEEEKQIKSGS